MSSRRSVRDVFRVPMSKRTNQERHFLSVLVIMSTLCGWFVLVCFSQSYWADFFVYHRTNVYHYSCWSGKRSSVLVTEHWARSYPCVQAANLSSPLIGCHYFPPGLRSPSQPKNVTIFWLVPSCTAWWQRHIGVNNWSEVVTRLFPGWNWTQDLLIANPMPYHYATVPPVQEILEKLGEYLPKWGRVGLKENAYWEVTESL